MEWLAAFGIEPGHIIIGLSLHFHLLWIRQRLLRHEADDVRHNPVRAASPDFGGMQ